MANKVHLAVEMDVTVPQALALQAMFRQWNSLAAIGGSRDVSFYVDGDGDFHPHVEFRTDKPLPPLTKELLTLASPDGIHFDYDNIAWRIEEE